MFNNFVRNYELAYWGPNTANYQIDSTIMNSKLNYIKAYNHLNAIYIICTEEYSQFKDDFLDEKGDEWLPLGKSFQKHVKLYMRYRNPTNVITSVKVTINTVAVYLQISKFKNTQKESLIILSMFNDSKYLNKIARYTLGHHIIN